MIEIENDVQATVVFPTMTGDAGARRLFADPTASQSDSH
jgi:hypothetical protein